MKSSSKKIGMCMGYNKKQLERGLGMCCISHHDTTIRQFSSIYLAYRNETFNIIETER